MSIPSPLATGSAPEQGYRKAWNVNRKGLSTSIPPANEVMEGTLYYSTDTFSLQRSNGTIWEPYAIGDPGLSSSVFFYRFDNGSTNPSDPGTGLFKCNNINMTLVTEMYFDWLTDDGFDVHLLYQLFNTSTRFIMQDKALAVTYQVWEITSPAINMPDWFKLPVTLQSTSSLSRDASPFKQYQRLATILIPSYATGIING